MTTKEGKRILREVGAHPVRTESADAIGFVDKIYGDEKFIPFIEKQGLTRNVNELVESASDRMVGKVAKASRIETEKISYMLDKRVMTLEKDMARFRAEAELDLKRLVSGEPNKTLYENSVKRIFHKLESRSKKAALYYNQLAGRENKLEEIKEKGVIFIRWITTGKKSCASCVDFAEGGDVSSEEFGVGKSALIGLYHIDSVPAIPHSNCMCDLIEEVSKKQKKILKEETKKKRKLSDKQNIVRGKRRHEEGLKVENKIKEELKKRGLLGTDEQRGYRVERVDKRIKGANHLAFDIPVKKDKKIAGIQVKETENPNGLRVRRKKLEIAVRALRQLDHPLKKGSYNYLGVIREANKTSYIMLNKGKLSDLEKLLKNKKWGDTECLTQRRIKKLEVEGLLKRITVSKPFDKIGKKDWDKTSNFIEKNVEGVRVSDVPPKDEKILKISGRGGMLTVKWTDESGKSYNVRKSVGERYKGREVLVRIDKEGEAVVLCKNGQPFMRQVGAVGGIAKGRPEHFEKDIRIDLKSGVYHAFRPDTKESISR